MRRLEPVPLFDDPLANKLRRHAVDGGGRVARRALPQWVSMFHFSANFNSAIN